MAQTKGNQSTVKFKAKKGTDGVEWELGMLDGE